MIVGDRRGYLKKSQKIHAGSSWFLTVRGMRVKFSCSEKCFSIFSGIFCIDEQIGVTYAR